MNYSKYYNKGSGWLKKNWKVVLIIFLLLIAFKVLKKLWDLVSGWFQSDKEKEDKINSDKQIIDEVSVNSTALTHPASFYTSIANQLEDCMRDVGTQFDNMVTLLTPLNGEELKQVYREFGLRRYYLFGFEVAYGDLFVWFNQELSAYSLFGGRSEIEIMREIWAKSKIW